MPTRAVKKVFSSSRLRPRSRSRIRCLRLQRLGVLESLETRCVFAVDAYPYVVSFDPVLVNSSIITYALEFSEPVTGVGQADFTQVTTGTASGLSPLSVVGNGRLYTVSVTGIDGNGTLRLKLIDDGTIRDGNGNRLTSLGAAPRFFDQQNRVVDFVPGSMATADLNADLNGDVIVASLNNNSIEVLFGNASDSFGLRNTFASIGNPLSVAIGDTTGNGKTDLIVLGGSSLLSVMVGAGDGTFGAGQSIDLSVNNLVGIPTSLAAGDLNGDTILDLVIATDTNGVAVLSGNGDGTFTYRQSFEFTSNPASVAISDLNADAFADLIVADSSGFITVLMGCVDGTFASQPAFAGTVALASLAVGDLNNDRFPDCVVVSNTGTLSFYLGKGDGQFMQRQLIDTSAGLHFVGISDVNGDGRADIIATKPTSSSIVLWMNDSDASFSSPITTITHIVVPDAPLIESVVAGNASAVVTWSAPKSDGGAPVTSYIIQFSNNYGRRWVAYKRPNSTVLSQNITGLTNGQKYVFKVQAINSAGKSANSVMTAPVLPASPPSAPTITSVVRGNACALVSWIRPFATGGEAIRSYNVFSSANSGRDWSLLVRAPSTATNVLVPDLTNGTAFVFKIEAVNSIGIGHFSKISYPVVPCTVPGAPVNVGVSSFQSTSVVLSWGSPEKNGGLPITNYTVTVSIDKGITWKNFVRPVATALSTVVSGLTIGTEYLFRVAAVNPVGTGPASNPTVPTILVGVPNAPKIVSAAPGDECATLTWTAPLSNGSAITNYTISFSSDGGSTWSPFSRLPSPALSVTVTGLTNGLGYIFRVNATNLTGVGPNSLSTAVLMPRRVSDAPTSLLAEPRNESVALTWVAPINSGSSSITRYEVRFSSTNGQVWTLFAQPVSQSLATVVTGLKNNTPYVFKVNAVTLAGAGLESMLSASVIPTGPVMPSNFLPAVTDIDLRTLAWQLTIDGSINRQDMIQLLKSTGADDGTVDVGEFNSLREIVSQSVSLHMPDFVKVLASDVVNGNAANQTFQGQSLGNLAVNSSAVILNRLVDKWFLGLDHPRAENNVYRNISGQLFVGGPSHTDVRQGSLGDCYLLASMGSLAWSNATAVFNMFVSNGDGTWTIRFYETVAGSYVADYVTVDSMLPTDTRGKLVYANRGFSYNSVSNELWVPLVEKAYVQWTESGKAGRPSPTNDYTSISDGWMGNVVRQSLGLNASTFYGFTNSQQAGLINAVQTKMAVTIGTKSSASTGLVGSHAYIITGYDAATLKFQLYNPWGFSHPGPLTWAELANNCDAFVVGDASQSLVFGNAVSALLTNSAAREAMFAVLSYDSPKSNNAPRTQRGNWTTCVLR